MINRRLIIFLVMFGLLILGASPALIFGYMTGLNQRWHQQLNQTTLLSLLGAGWLIDIVLIQTWGITGFLLLIHLTSLVLLQSLQERYSRWQSLLMALVMWLVFSVWGNLGLHWYDTSLFCLVHLITMSSRWSDTQPNQIRLKSRQ